MVMGLINLNCPAHNLNYRLVTKACIIDFDPTKPSILQLYRR